VREAAVICLAGAGRESAGVVVVVLEEKPQSEARLVAAGVGAPRTMCRQARIEAARWRQGAAGPSVGFKGGAFQLLRPNGGWESCLRI
jgi:hypothetical protein